MSPVEIQYGAATDTGRVRSRNEDSYLVWIPESADSEPRGVFLVADGMGGHEAGDVASRFVVAELERAIAGGQTFSEREYAAGLRRWFAGVSRSLVHLAESRGASRGMGSTATLAVLIDRRLILGHVGDSRIYRWRKGQMEQLSLDHSFAEEQRRRGLLTREEAAHHPQRNLLTQALGVDSELDAQIVELEWKDGDRFLLCSDGLHGPVGLDEMAGQMDAARSPQDAAAGLVRRANEAGGPDNITAVVFELRGEGSPPPIEPPLESEAGESDQVPTDPGPFPPGPAVDEAGEIRAHALAATKDGRGRAAASGATPPWVWVAIGVALVALAALLWRLRGPGAP